MATLAISDGSVYDTANFGSSAPSWEGQGFTVDAGVNITSVAIKGSKGNNATAGTFKVQIYEGGAEPDAGTLLYEETFDRDILPAYTASPVLEDIVFTGDVTPLENLTGGTTQYWLVLQVLTGSTNDCIRWSIEYPSSYAGGNRVYSSDGTTWTDAGYDHNFAVYGTEGGGGGGGNTTNFFLMM